MSLSCGLGCDANLKSASREAQLKGKRLSNERHLVDVLVAVRVGLRGESLRHHGAHRLALQEVTLYEPQHVACLQPVAAAAAVLHRVQRGIKNPSLRRTSFRCQCMHIGSCIDIRRRMERAPRRAQLVLIAATIDCHIHR